MFCSFCLIEPHKTGINSTTAKTREKIRTELESLEICIFMQVSLNLKTLIFYVIKLATRFW
jgi:hypothetical protein